MMEFGAECLATSRFDTVVPLEFVERMWAVGDEIIEQTKDDPEAKKKLWAYWHGARTKRLLGELWAGVEADPFWQGEYRDYASVMRARVEIRVGDMNAARETYKRIPQDASAYGPPHKTSGFDRNAAAGVLREIDHDADPRAEQ